MNKGWFSFEEKLVLSKQNTKVISHVNYQECIRYYARIFEKCQVIQLFLSNTFHPKHNYILSIITLSPNSHHQAIHWTISEVHKVTVAHLGSQKFTKVITIRSVILLLQFHIVPTFRLSVQLKGYNYKHIQILVLWSTPSTLQAVSPSSK